MSFIPNCIIVFTFLRYAAMINTRMCVQGGGSRQCREHRRSTQFCYR